MMSIIIYVYEWNMKFLEHSLGYIDSLKTDSVLFLLQAVATFKKDGPSHLNTFPVNISVIF